MPPLRPFLLLAILVVAHLAPARDLYVNNQTGDDRLNGAAPLNAGDGIGPVRSINRALALSSKGDRVILTNTGEPYRESLSLVGDRHSGNGFTPFTIEGNGAVLDGSVATPLLAWEHWRDNVFRFRPRRQSYQQLFRDGLPLVRRDLTPEGGVPSLEPLQWCLREGYIYFRTEPDRLVRDYHLTHAGLQTGITIYHCHDLAISDLIVQGFHLDGVNANDVNGDTVLTGITSRGNGRAGVTVAGASQVHLLDCVIGDNGRAQLYCEAPAVAVVINSNLIPNTAPAIVQRGGEVYEDGHLVENPTPAPRRW